MLRGLIELNGDNALTLAAREYRIDLTATLNDTSLIQSAQAACVQAWTPDMDNTDEAFSMTAQRIVTSPGTVTKRYTLSIPDLSYSSGNVDKADGPSLSAHLVFEDIALIVERDATWRLDVGSIDWVLDGASEHSWSGLTFYGSLLTPSGVPMFGIVPLFSASAGNGTALALPPSPDENPYDKSAYATAVVGFRDKYPGDGSWTAHPVYFSLPTDTDSGDCALCVSSPTDDVQADDSYTVTLEARAQLTNEVVDLGVVELSCDPPCTTSQTRQYHLYSSDITERATAEAVHVHGDFVRGVVRLNTDYAGMVYRYGMPKQTSRSSWTCGDCSETGTSFGNVGFPLLQQSDYLFVASDSTHAAEDTFSKRPACLYSYSESVVRCRGIKAVLVRAGICSKPLGYEGDCNFTETWDTTVEVCCRTYGSDNMTVQRRDGGLAGNAKMAGYLAVPSSSAPEPTYGYAARYTNYWLCPHWSYVLWFPPDGVYGSSYAWPLRGASTDPTDYWLPLKSQWLYHTRLSTGELRRTRVDVVAEPLAQSGLDSWTSGTVFGQVTSFWGSRGFVSVDVELEAPVSVQLDSGSSAAWTVTDASASFTTAGIVLTGL